MPIETPGKLDIPTQWQTCTITGMIQVIHDEWFAMNGCFIERHSGGEVRISKPGYTTEDMNKTIDAGLQTCWDNWAGSIEIVFS